MLRNPGLVMRYLTEIEEMAEEILTDKQHIVAMDYKRNKNREAIRCLITEMKEEKSRGKHWIFFGSTFIQMSNDKSIQLLEKDQAELNKEIDSLRNGLKHKVDKLRDMEGKPQLKGFHLEPLSKLEMSAINQVIYGTSRSN
uniref:Uncharacterized protein n=1 Tax=Strigamia maritima TaxID=126957 RepID=T1JF41_STRMM